MGDLMATGESKPLSGKVALVAGATRGAGRAIAVELARAGTVVYATGRSSRVAGPSEVGRPETIEETGDLIAAAGGDGMAVHVPYTLERDEDGVWCASAQLRPGVGAVGDGATADEAIADLREALTALIEEVGVPPELTLTLDVA
jgi:NAD(P)-dependent dehydrogenase (short-subunit alcohol dehydrogenase family)